MKHMIHNIEKYHLIHVECQFKADPIDMIFHLL